MTMKGLLITVAVIIAFTSCKTYKQDILFKFDEEFTPDDLSMQVERIEGNYVIQPNDFLQLDVFTNKGEQIIDPNFELGPQGNNGQMNNPNFQNQRINLYLVQTDGYAKFPVVGMVKVDSLTLQEAEAKLQNLYDEYYKDSFVRLVYNNKRVVVMGANGGQVIPLTNENMSLVEILAMYGGLEFGAKANNIKIIRGNLEDPEIFMIDLATVSGMRQSIIQVRPGDVIYVEPWRRAGRQFLSDVSPIISLISSLIAVTLVISNLGN